MYYHASQVPDIKVLEPRTSNHKKPFVYLSSKRENVLVYLSNAIEKYCKDTGFAYEGPWQKWGPYGFAEDGRLRLEEYYPNAFEETYRGVSGYIYSTSKMPKPEIDIQIKDAMATAENVLVENVEFVEDAYEAIMDAAQKGLIELRKYEEQPQKQLEWIERIITSEYADAIDKADYKYFLENKFPFVLEEG